MSRISLVYPEPELCAATSPTYQAQTSAFIIDGLPWITYEKCHKL
jgi:hypothetical protein